MRAKEPTTERDGRGGGLAFSLWQGREGGTWRERGTRLRPEFEVSKGNEFM